MRLRRFVPLAVLGLSMALSAAQARGDDFDPRGRKKPGAAKPTGAPNRKPAPTVARPVTSEGGGGGGGKAPAEMIARYTKVVLGQPGAPFPLQRLAQLYRDRDGNVAELVKDLEARAGQAGADAYAALVALAGVLKLDGRSDDARARYEQAIALKSSDPVALRALARLHQDRGDLAAARARYEQALALESAPSDREQSLRTLMTLALDAKDWDAARSFHKELVKLQPTSLFLRGELGRELYQRAEYERAEVELKELVTAASGDNRALAPALKDLGRAQAKAHKTQEALATLKRALQVAGQEAAVRAEIFETIVELYRADQQLAVLIKQLEDEHPTDFQRLSILGALYEETGDSAKAQKTYARALAVNPRHIDLRLKVIRLLESQGELDKAIVEYEALIRAAPNNPVFVFEQCDALMQRGDRARALRLLTDLEARGQSDEEVLSRLADFYGRIGESERSLKVLARLSRLATNDPGHIVDLGDRYFQDGNAPLAVETWKRMLSTVTPRARALAALGDVYLEHDMVSEALAALREAAQLEPQTLSYKKQLATALERSKSYREARQLWTELGEKAKANGDKLLSREARTRIVALWGFERVLEAQVPSLSARFNGKPPDIEAGRMLAEVLLRLRRSQDLATAEATLATVIEAAPGDSDSYLALERVLVQQGKLPEAIRVLEKLAVVDPKSARQLYGRMAEYAQQIYRDDEAITYAARAVELNPDDAEGHHKLGERYRKKQDIDRAIVEFRAAIAKNDRLFSVYFDLADLLLAKGEVDEADRLFRRVMRGSPDEELVSRSARLSMQINLGRSTLESLEQDLLPLAIGNPQKKVYRRLIVELYGSLTFALVQRVKHGSGKDADDARAALRQIGSRALKPLLDALADGDAGEQRVAIDVLGYVANRNASAALFAYATGQAATSLRVRAMLACGDVRDPALLPKYEALLSPPSSGSSGATMSDAVARSAAWAVAKLGEPRAAALLRKLARSGTPDMRAFAVLGLGALRDTASVPLLAQLARSVEAGASARAAAVYVLGELGAESEKATLVTMAHGTDALVRRFALLALARMGDKSRATVDAMADAMFAPAGEGERSRRASESLRQAAMTALVMLAAKDRDRSVDPLPPPDEAGSAEVVLDKLVLRTLLPKERAAALVAFAEPLGRAAATALGASTERARVVLDAMTPGEGAFEPLLGAAEEGAEVAAAHGKALELARALEPSMVPLARHPEPSVRTKAILLLARSSSDAAATAVAEAVTDATESVVRVALASIGRTPDLRAVALVSGVLAAHESWPLRVLAAQALGRLGAAGAARETTPVLRKAASEEPYALVRQASMLALASYDKKAAALVAAELNVHDPEPRVREAAEKLLTEP